jgi:probable phosphoglycerate mutase
MQNGNVISEAKKVFDGIDTILERNGYIREGHLYRAVNPNRDTIALFCHFGVECVILSHLLGISPVILWHGFCALPSSVTTLVTEERRKGIACFRMIAFGDISHLYTAGEAPAFSGRFCETYDNFDERHD